MYAIQSTCVSYITYVVRLKKKYVLGGFRGVIFYYIQSTLDFVNLDWQVVKHAVLKGLKRLFWTLTRLNCNNKKALRKGWVLACQFDTSYYAYFRKGVMFTSQLVQVEVT